MRFNTHEETPANSPSTALKVALILVCLLVYGIILGMCIWAWPYHDPIWFKIFFLSLFILLPLLPFMMCYDLTHAYVEISEDTVTVVDHYCFIKRERQMRIQDVESVEIREAFEGRGYHLRGKEYLYFLNSKGKYLFKLIKLPETEDLILQYLQFPPHDKTGTR